MKWLKLIFLLLFITKPLISKNIGYITYGYGPHYALDKDFVKNLSEKTIKIFPIDSFNLEITNHKLYDRINHIPIDKILFFSLCPINSLKLKLKSIQQKTDCELILIIYEPPTVQPWLFHNHYLKYFHKIFTYQDDIIDNKRFFKSYYPVLRPMTQYLKDFQEKKLCCLVSGKWQSTYINELYSERKKAIAFFEKFHPQDFSFGGSGWIVNKDYPKTCQGRIKDKDVFLKNFKFSICYENTKELPGYITEKIFDCFHNGCIPIYWGAPNITDHIPENCFIDKRKFNSYEELYDFISNITEEEYNQYITNIQKYLNSKEAQAFTPENYWNSLEKLIVD